MRGVLSADAQTFLAAGLLGGFTTFSAFAFETSRLLATGARAPALLYAAGSVVIGLAAVAVGSRIGRGGGFEAITLLLAAHFLRRAAAATEDPTRAADRARPGWPRGAPRVRADRVQLR